MKQKMQYHWLYLNLYGFLMVQLFSKLLKHFRGNYKLLQRTRLCRKKKKKLVTYISILFPPFNVIP